MMSLEDLVGKIQQSFDNKEFDKFITDITFPKFKSFAPKTKINFRFPITVIVGPNGGGKSSVLHAAWGIPLNHSTRRFWFSTPIDPIINEQKNPNRYWYSHYIKKIDTLAQCMKISERTEELGYWEPARPAQKDGMNKMPKITAQIKPFTSKSGDRWNQVDRESHYINSKSESSAFDRFFTYTEFNSLKDRQEYFAKYSGKFKKLLSGLIKNYYSRSASADYFVDALSLKKINRILHKNYKSARYIQHNFYEQNYSPSVIFETNKLAYSECFAGSGELAVVNFVLKLNKLKDYDLLLLDEPETSLHPAAQKELIRLLLEVALEKKIQVIISSHSPTFVESLPLNALVVLYESEEGISAKINPTKSSAFFSLGATEKEKITILTEDSLLEALVSRVIYAYLPKEIKAKLSVKATSDGVSAMLSNHVRAYMHPADQKVIMVIDGDMKKIENVFLQDLNTLSRNEKIELIKNLKTHQPSISITGSYHDQDGEILLLEEWVKWCKDRVFLIDDVCPEALLLRLYEPSHQLLKTNGTNKEFKAAIKSSLQHRGDDFNASAQHTLLKNLLGTTLKQESNPITISLKKFAAKIEDAINKIEN